MSGNNNPYGSALPDLGIQIRKWRLAKNLTQSALEEKAGLSHNTISRIECGSVSPRLQTITQISESLGISVEQLQFQEPAPVVAETKAEYGMDPAIVKLISALENVPGAIRGDLLKTFLNLIEITTGKGHE